MFDLDQVLGLLEKTPSALRGWLGGVNYSWLDAREKSGGWSVREIVGHLVFGEITDWVARAEIILAPSEAREFEPFDRGGHLEDQRTIEELLSSFGELRTENVKRVRSWALTEKQLDRTGVHPDFGTVTLRQLLATWAVHDMTHVAQIARILGKQYASDVGPWRAYLGVLHDREEQ